MATLPLGPPCDRAAAARRPGLSATTPQQRQLARRAKTSVGWFYGFRLHLVINVRGDLLAFCL